MRGANFVGLDTVIQQPLRGGKKNLMHGRITKKHEGASVMIAPNNKSNAYENMVKRRLLAESKDPNTFELSPRKWGQRVPGFPIVQHTLKGTNQVKYYFEVIFLRPGVSTYYLDGAEIDKNMIENMPPDIEPTDTLQAGLEHIVQIRTFALDSLVQIRIDQLNVVGPFYFKA